MKTSKDGVSLTSIAHPGSEPMTAEEVAFIEAGGWRCPEGHAYCELHPSPDPNPASLEEIDIALYGPRA